MKIDDQNETFLVIFKHCEKVWKQASMEETCAKQVGVWLELGYISLSKAECWQNRISSSQNNHYDFWSQNSANVELDFRHLMHTLLDE